VQVKNFWPGSGQPSLSWVWHYKNFLVKSQIFQFFAPRAIKNLIGSGLKVPGSKQGRPLIYCSQKYARIGSGPISESIWRSSKREILGVVLARSYDNWLRTVKLWFYTWLKQIFDHMDLPFINHLTWWSYCTKYFRKYNSQKLNHTWGRHGRGVIASVWESEGPGIKPWRVQGSNSSGYRQPLTQGCQKRTSDSLPKTVCLSWKNS